MWQEVIVFSMVILAALHVLRQFMPKPRRTLRIATTSVADGCGSCKACSGGQCH